VTVSSESAECKRVEWHDFGSASWCLYISWHQNLAL